MKNLNHTEDLKLTGRVELIATHKTTGKKIIVRTNNLRVTVGKTWLLNFLVNKSGYTNGFTYCALGNDNTTPAVGQTTLVAEQKRKPITSKDPITSGWKLHYPHSLRQLSLLSILRKAPYSGTMLQLLPIVELCGQGG